MPKWRQSYDAATHTLMKQNKDIWIGADPGGRRNFGLAILQSNGVARTWCLDHAEAAMTVLDKELPGVPSGVGVDAPLWWSSGRSSDRHADQWLRKKYQLTGGQVQTANSLRGAALVQGAMFVQRIREMFPKIGVTESHPKALRVAFRRERWKSFCKRTSIHTTLTGEEGHEHDAVLGALAAREGFEGRWTHDLSAKRHSAEQNPVKYWLGPVHYYWPEA
jgi:predicted nuclease with RNAse H fold